MTGETFAGADKLLRMTGELYQRPRFGDRARDLRETVNHVEWAELPDRRERSICQGLPLVCLVRSSSEEWLLTKIDKLIDNARPHGVRHAYLQLADGQPDSGSNSMSTKLTANDVHAVRDILRAARNRMIVCPRARDSRLRFPLFNLVDWLLDRRPKPDDDDPDRTMRARLKRQGITERLLGAARTAAQELPQDQIRWKIPVWALRLLTAASFRVAVTGRVPLLSGRYRWFLRQRYLAPDMSGTFVRFAQRLLDGEWQQRENLDDVARLLVNSFLEDLRRDYRLRLWHLFLARRMTYPVLLLDDITMTNGGYALLRLINDVRNEVGTFDPLLVISASREVPPDAGTRYADRPRFDAIRAVEAYRTWQRELHNDRRARHDTAWYLPIAIPTTSGTLPAELRRPDDGYVTDKRSSRPPLVTSRWLRVGVVVAVLAGGAYFAYDRYEQQCGTWQGSLAWTGSECIGVTDGSHDLFQPSDPIIQQVEGTILTQNEQAGQLHRTFPQRPYITLAVLQATTSPSGTSDGLTAERESLEGVAVLQNRQLTSRNGAADPIVRVLIANAGRGMLHGPEVARQLGDLADADHSLVGVIGLDMSSVPTADTITALADVGLPVVADTLSEDSLADNNPTYFQVAPQNRREAAVVAGFARHLATAMPDVPRSVRIYYSDDSTDTYSSNLRTDALQAFTAMGFRAQARAFLPTNPAVDAPAHRRFGDRVVGNANSAGQDTCQFNGFVFFAGRGVPDYGDFTSGAAQCASKAVFIGDDDVSRYVADAAERQGNRQLSFYYVSFGPAPIGSGVGPELDFYTSLNSLFPFEVDPTKSRSLDGHAALAYDAASTVTTAVSYLRRTRLTIPITPGAVWREITAIHSSSTGGVNNYIEGVTGAIDFGGDISRRVPLAKQVAFLQVSAGEVRQHVIGFCGAVGNRKQSAWCPPGSF